MELTLGSQSRIYLDTNVLIYITEGNDNFKSHLETLFIEIENKRAKLITSALVFTELLVLPYRNGNSALVSAYKELLNNFVIPLPVSPDVLDLAAQLRASTPAQKTPDAIHVATAILSKADAFVTGDAGIKNLPPSMLKIVIQHGQIKQNQSTPRG